MSSSLHAIACVSRDVAPEREDELRRICVEGTSGYAESGVTGFFLCRQSRLFGYLEGERTSVDELLAAVMLPEREALIRAVDLGELKDRRCDGWELRDLTESPIEIGLDTVLGQAILMHAPRDDERRRDLILRVVTRVVETMDVAATPGAECD